MRVGIVGQRDNERAEQLVATLADRLETEQVTPVIDAVTAAAIDRPGTQPHAMEDCTLAISIGGDGTFLYTARALGQVPLLGVNLGEVGMLNSVDPADAVKHTVELVERARLGTLSVQLLPRLQAYGSDWELEPAVNEIVVQGKRRGPGGGASTTVHIDGDRYGETHADGVLVSTPIGSTAYNLSEGGPLVHPNVETLIVTPMCPADGTRPLAVTPETTVEITIEDSKYCHVIADGRERRSFDTPTTVQIETTAEPLKIVETETTFFEALQKLR